MDFEFDPIFASDLAAEVRTEFADLTDVGVSAQDATEHVVVRFGNLLSDPNDGPVVILALAAIQLKQFTLIDGIGNAAIELIESREAERACKEIAIPGRRAFLDRFAAALRSAINRV